jgi:formate dehydrogenase major subunit
VEEAGSVTNSGRWLQWRQQARQPKDNSKADLELVLRLAKALDVAGTFSHIPLDAAFANRYEQLYAYYGWTPGQAFDSEKIAENVFKEFAAPQAEAYAGTDASKYTINAGDPLLRGATMWIYYNAYCKNLTEAGFGGADTDAWGDANRAKSRVTVANTAKTFSKWGWAWLKNRRVFYNNGEVPQDVSDNFVGPDYVARLYINRNVSVVDYAAGAGLAYRNYKVMKDVSSIDTTHPNGVNGTNTYGQFPAHSEPVETSKTTLAGTWGYNNYIDTASYDANTWVQANGALFHECVMSDTLKGDVGTYPLTMISVRCVEHFQGGPITRNNEWNVQLEPEPWIEINPLDARKYGISDGDLVNVVTARSNSAGPTALNPTRVDDQASRTSVSGFAKGFRARVDSSIAVYQRVAPGVVAIPWHWGDRGLSTGSRANDLCIDAFDANTKIPEYKACLCRIEKA